MVWNGIGAYLNAPGMIPWPIMVGYFVIAGGFAFFWGRKTGGTRAFKTRDLVIIAVGVAIGVVWEFTLGSMIEAPFSSVPFIHLESWGSLFMIYVVAGVVRKVGTGMISMAIYDILASGIFYGFGGQPIYVMYEVLTYGLFIDLVIAIRGGKLYGIGLRGAKPEAQPAAPPSVGPPAAPAPAAAPVPAFQASQSRVRPIVDGAIMGFLWSIPGSFFYIGFFSPFLYGGIVSWAAVLFDFYSYLPGYAFIFGPLAGLASRRVARAIGG